MTSSLLDLLVAATNGPNFTAVFILVGLLPSSTSTSTTTSTKFEISINLV